MSENYIRLSSHTGHQRTVYQRQGKNGSLKSYYQGNHEHMFKTQNSAAQFSNLKKKKKPYKIYLKKFNFLCRTLPEGKFSSTGGTVYQMYSLSYFAKC